YTHPSICRSGWRLRPRPVQSALPYWEPPASRQTRWRETVARWPRCGCHSSHLSCSHSCLFLDPLRAGALLRRRHEFTAGVARTRFRNRTAAVTPFDRGRKAELLGIALEPQALGTV